MADYSIKLGVELDTKKIDSQINAYKAKKPIELSTKLDTGNIDKAIASYKAKSQIEVDAKLNTVGIAKKIGEYKPKTPVVIRADLNTADIDSAISAYASKNKKVTIGVNLDTKNIQSEIQSYISKTKPSIELEARLDNKAIDTAIQNYKPKQRIKVALALNAADIEEKIREYEARSLLRVKVKINKTDINKQLSEYNDADSYITVKAKLDNGAISEAIRNYKAKTPIKVDLTLDHTDIDNKISTYAKSPVEISARLKTNVKDVNEQLKNNKIIIPIKLNVMELDTQELDKKISSYKTNVPIKVGVKLDGKDINAQIIKLAKPTEPINVGIKLDKSAINADIALFKPTATLGIQPDLILENVDDQIMAYVPKVKFKVGVDLNNGDIDAEMKKKNAQSPIQVNVKIDRKSINEQLRTFTTKTKVNVGIKLDSKGIAEQLKKINPKTKIKAGVQLDKDDVIRQIQSFKTDSPIKLGVELDKTNVQSQIDNIRQQLEKLGNIKINLIGVGDDSRGGVDGADDKSGAGRRSISALSVAHGFKEANIEIKATDKAIENLGVALKTIGFNSSSVESITNDFKILGVTVTNVTSKLNSDGSVKLTVKGLDQFKDAVTYVNNIKTDGSLGAWSETISSDVNKVAEKFDRLKSLAKDIGNLKIDIFKSSNDADEVKRLTNELNRLQAEYKELFNSTQSGLKPNQIGQLENIARNSEAALAKLKKEYAETRAELAKEIRGSLSSYDAEVKSLEISIDRLVKPTDNVKLSLENVKQALIDMRSASNNDELIEAEDRYQKELKETQAQLLINQSTEKQYGGTGEENFAIKKEAALIRISNLFENGSQAAKRFGAEARKLTKELNKVGSESGIEKVNAKIANLEKKIKMSNLQTKTFATRLRDQFSKYSQYLSIASVFMYAAQAARSMFEQVKLIDSAMTELKKVTDETDAAYDKFLTNAASKAKEIGTTIDGLVSSTADFARLGYGFEDAQGLAEVANIYAVVGDEIEGVEGATESLISTMAAFKDETSDISNTDFAMDIVDKFNEIGNNFAISSGGIGEAMERSASSMKAANNTIDETIALITAANTVVQNPDAVGTAFKTISMRIRGATTELEEAGLETEGMAKSTAKLRQEIMALSGVDIMEADGQTFKSTYAILDELALKWKDLSDIQQATITELIAGKRQGNIISSLMNNFDTARSALETSLKSSGSAMKEHEKWQESLEARINSLKASWQSLSQTFLSSKFLKVGMDAIAGLVDGIDILIDRFGIINTLIAGKGLFGAFKRGFALDADGKQVGAYWGITNAFKGLGAEFKNIGTYFKGISGLSKDLTWKLLSIGEAGKQAGRQISEAFSKSKDSLKVMLKDIAQVVVVMNIIKAAQDIFSWISDAGEDAETTAEKFDRISSELSDVESELSGLKSELSGVESQIDALLEKDELTFTDEEELSRLREVSSELERQIQLAETLQESLNKSLSSTAIDAYDEYASNTSFYSDKSKQERKDEGSSLGSSIGNIVGLIGGAVLAYFTGGTSLMLGAAIGSTVGSFGGSLLGGAISGASYNGEVTVSEMLDRMHIERVKLEKAQKEAYETYTKSPTGANKEAWEEATAALSDYNTVLAEHISQLSEYYNSIDYNALETAQQKADYLTMGDILDKYNIEMGVAGAKSTALGRIFSDELITKEAKGLRAAIEAALNSGEEINFADFNSEQFTEINGRLSDMGLTIVDVVGYFEDLAKSEEEAANNFETYEIVSNIAALSDGVTALTDAFAEFNEQGIVTAKTLSELHEVFGNLGEYWTNYVDIMTNGIASVDDARKATEQLVEAYTDDLFKNGGIKFSKYDKTANNGIGGYVFDEDGYKTYLSTINQFESLGVENAKEYTDALQQQAMVRESAAQIAKDSAEKEALLAKETLTEKEKTRLSVLEAKKIDDYILDIENAYGIRLKDSALVQKQYELDEYNSVIKDREEQLGKITNYLDEYQGLSDKAEDAFSDYETAKSKGEAIESKIFQENLDRSKYGTLTSESGMYIPTWNDFEAIDDLFGTNWIHTDFDDAEKYLEDADAYYTVYEEHLKSQKDKFNNLVDIAKEADIDLSDIIPDVDNFEFDAAADNAGEIFEQVYNRVESELNSSIDRYGDLASEASAEIEERLNNLGLEIDFGRNFDKIIIDGLKTDLEALNTAMSEAVSGGGLSTDSIIAIEEIFGDLNSYDSSSLFEHTANGIRLNTEEFRKLNDELKSSNVDSVKNKLNALGDEYNKTREELSDLEYGTDEYNSTISKLDGLEKQIKMTEEFASSLEGLFSAYQNWQRVEASGSQRDMYERMIGGFENMDDEISRGWLDDGTIEFLKLIKGENISATATTKELMKAYQSLDDTIEHTGYSIRDFFTVDENGNSTNAGVYNFLDAIGQMEEEKFGGKDVVQRDKDGNVIGFDFKLVGGDQAIADALGVSKELVQIMVRAADDAGFVISMDGTYQQLDILKEKASEAATTLKDELGKTDHNFFEDGSKTGVLNDYEEALKIWQTYSKNKNADGTVNMEVEGAEEAFTLVSTLQSMVDKLSEPVYMELDASEVDKDMQTPLSKLQEYERLVKQENQLKLKGTDTSEIDKSQKEIIDYLNELSPEIKADLGIKNDSWEEIQRKVESGEIEIPATVDLQVEMNDTLRDMVNVALYNAGVIDEEEFKKRVDIELYADNVDASDVEEKTEDAVDSAVDGSASREQNIKIVAETFGVEDVEGLKNAMSGLTDEQIKAIAEAIGKGDVDALDSAVEGMDNKTVDAIANALGYDGVESLKFAVKNMQGNEVYAKVNTDGQQKKVDTFQSWIDGLVGKVVPVTVSFIKSGFDAVSKWFDKDEGGSGANGTADVNGTTGKAFKQGSWGTKNSGTALVGELGPEVLVRDGRYYTIGDVGAEFIRYRKGDIIFNHRQTEELFANGQVTSGSGRAKALVGGTAFSSGTGGIGKVAPSKKKVVAKNKGRAVVKDEERVVSKTTAENSGNSTIINTQTTVDDGSAGYEGTGDSNKGDKVGTTDKFEKTFDWIEIKISRIERVIDQLDQKANNVYKSWSERNRALADEIGEVGDEIKTQEAAYDAYMQKAKDVGLDESYANKVRNGTINIQEFEGASDEALVEKIKEYQEWYEKALACQDAILDLKEAESELYNQRFENIQAQYDGILQGYEHTEAMLNEYISQAEARGHIVSKNYYQALIDNEKSNIAELKKEQSALIKSRDEAVASGAITRGSQAWYEMCSEIDSVTQSIEEGNTALIEYANSMRDIDWQIFDFMQERISDVTKEADFLIELMSNKKLYEDDGKLTSQGLATMGLHAQNVNTYMYQADEYGAEVVNLDAQIAKDPYDQELINRRNEILELQRESILAAENEKNAIRDMVEEGINLELDALQERIDKYNESIEAAKDLYDYQKNVQKQSEEIASLEKQRAAYLGNDSEEGRAKLQEIEVSLKEAKEGLQETEYERYISDQQELLDTLYNEYELILNQRLDNVDALLTQVIDSINTVAGVDGVITSALGNEGALAVAIGSNATSIKDTLSSEANKVGTTLSTAMNNIWSVGDGNAKSVLTTYGEDFKSKLTTTNTVLNGIKISVDSMIAKLDKGAEKKVEEKKTSASSTNKNRKDTPSISNLSSSLPSSSGGDGKAKIGDKVTFVSGQYYYDSQGQKPIGSQYLGKEVYITNINEKSWATHPYHIASDKAGKHPLGWLKLNQISGYAVGKKNFLDNEIAWTQEGGKQEFIVRPSDGAILTPIAKGDSVLTSAASSNIWNMANSPAEFIRDNLGIASANVPNGSTVHSNYTQHIDNVVFRMDNVKNYDEMLSAMQKDKNFERLVLSMSIDRLAGKSSLAKGKSIR